MNNFKYLQPKSLKEASDILIKGANGSVAFAGGSDVLGLIKNSIISPEEVVNLKNIPELNKIKYTEGKGLQIGALVTIAEIAEHTVIGKKYTLLKEAAKEVASPQLRNIGTLGGNLLQRPRCWYFREEFNCLRKGGNTCFAFDGQNKYHCVTGGGPCFIVHPSDMAVALTALDAKITIFSNKNSRTIALKDFFVLPDTDFRHENILKPGEIVTEILIPELPQNTKSKFIKFKERGVWDFAVLSIAAVIQTNDNKIESGKIAFGGVAPVPYQEESLNLMLKGIGKSETSISSFSEQILAKADPLEMNKYKIPMARNLAKRILADLLEV